MRPKTSAELVAAYDRASRPWWGPFSQKKLNGVIDGGETELTLRGNTPDAPFVRDLSALPADEFAQVPLSDQAAKRYLYNKYGGFFATYDAGYRRAFLDPNMAATPLDGHIEPVEIARGGGIKQMIADLADAITDPKDLRLLSKLDLCTHTPHSIRLKSAAANLAKAKGDPVTGV
jgi:hypothetical protein